MAVSDRGQTYALRRQGTLVGSLCAAQVLLLDDILPLGFLVTVFAVGVVGFAQWGVHLFPQILVWIVAMAAVTASCCGLTWMYRRPCAPRMQWWGQRYGFAIAVAGSVWGLASIVFFPTTLLSQLSLLFLLTAMTAAAVVSFVPRFPMAFLFVVPALMPLTVRFWIAGGNLHVVMGTAGAMSMVVMLMVARRIEGAMATSLRSQMENQKLMAQLEMEKLVIERLRAQLNGEIEERTRITEHLQEREGYLCAVLENVEEGIVTFDQTGVLCSLNREALRIFGYTAEEIVGSHFSALVPAVERSEYARYLANPVAHTGTRMAGLGLEVNGLRRDGTVFPMELGISGMQVANQRHFVGITRDITRKKRAERLKNDLVSLLSHELKTPLTSAVCSLSLLAEAVTEQLDIEARGLLKIARHNLDRLGHVVNDVLDIDHMQLSHRQLAPSRVILIHLAEEVLAVERDYAGSRGVRLSLDPCSSLAAVQGDRALLLRALDYLIINAIHLSPHNSTVEISVNGTAYEGILSVRDCGAPIPEEVRLYLFESFGMTPPFGPAVPLGLSVVRTIVEKHGGSVGYEPRTAGGSHFFFSLPLTH